MVWATYGNRHSCRPQRRPDPALDGPEMRQTFIMGLALRSVVPLEMLDVRLPEEDWIGELSPNHGASKTPFLAQLCCFRRAPPGKLVTEALGTLCHWSRPAAAGMYCPAMLLSPRPAQ